MLALLASSMLGTRSYAQGMAAPDESGQMQVWAVECGPRYQPSGDGVTRESLKPGDHVIVTGNPGRSSENHRL